MMCALTLCGILVAGLWPFHRPVNDVHWSPSADGLVFGHYGVVMSSGPLPTVQSETDVSCAFEIWLQSTPTRNGSTILTLYTPENGHRFAVGKWQTGLVLRSSVHDGPSEGSSNNAFVANAFHDGKSVFISVTSDGHKSVVYVDGAPVTPNRDFMFSAKDLTGWLVVGTSPETSDEWEGQLRGVAVYRRSLTPGQVLRNYDAWTTGKYPTVAADASAVAVYSFDERRGNIVRNLVDGGPNLFIPKYFSLPHQPMLQAPFAGFKWTWGYWLDVAINIAGFVPLGFFFCACFPDRRSPAALITSVLAGTATTLIIELLQASLPTRNSGLNDILTNTLGAYLGAGLCRRWPDWFPFARRLA